MHRGARLICHTHIVRSLAGWALAFGMLCSIAGSVRAQVDTARTMSDTTQFHMTKSPMRAVLYSAVLPGAGQVYVGQAWKVPIIVALAGGFMAGALVQNHRYLQEWDNVTMYNAKRTAADTVRALEAASRREFYRDDRDKWWIYLGLTYVANLLDAYISAHLYDFDVSTPTTSGFRSYYDPGEHAWGVGWTLRF